MEDEILLKVSELGVSTNYGKAKISAIPVEEMLYAIKLIPGSFQIREDGTKVFTIEGVRHILNELTNTLNLQKEDF